MNLESKVSLLKGVGEKTNANLIDLKIETINDLLFYLPKKYTIYLNENINLLNEDKLVIVSGKVKSLVAKKIHYNQEMLIVYIDYLGKNLKCIFFGQGYLKYNLRKDKMISICGLYSVLNKEIIGHKLLEDFKDIYIDIDYKSNISNSLFNKLNEQIFNLNFELIDPLPEHLRNKYKLLSLKDYLYKSHFPANYNDIKQIIRRRKYEEFLEYTTSLKLLENNINELPKVKRIFDITKINEFINKLPYKLTNGQIEALNSILNDIKNDTVMNRLLEGDVGSGKTIISFLAMLAEILSGYQVLLMAPTELLAKQHYDKFISLTKPFNLETRLLTSSIKKQYVDEIVNGLNSGRINCLISTQAALYHKDMFDNLGLIVIDEQHRFGVEQRAKLLNENKNCDALYLSATPIPRTLGLTRFGDLSLSKLEEKPLGRKNVNTKIINSLDLLNYKDMIINEINNNHQIFVVVSQIEENSIDAYDIDSALNLFKELVPNAKIAKLNGKLSESYKNKVMMDFSNHVYDILVSTTVIEVGIDIKDATMMFILNAERFGLSTLHQLRGRVGRNSFDSYCYLVTKQTNNPRLLALANTSDCFELSEIDLKLRGPGDVLGTEQSGFINLDFENDYKIYECALIDSTDLINNYKESLFINNIQSKLKEKNNKLN